MIRVLVSSCLLGEAVRYDGGDLLCEHAILRSWIEEGRVVAVCPEVEGGLPTPRPACEIVGGSGEDVLDGVVRLVDREGRDTTVHFLLGARVAVEKARTERVGIAVLAEGSPSCGSSWIYDGSFAGERREGRGVTAARLERNGISVFSQDQLEEASEALQRLERAGQEITRS